MEGYNDSKLIYGRRFLDELKKRSEGEQRVVLRYLDNLNQNGPLSGIDLLPESEGHSVSTLGDGTWAIKFVMNEKGYRIKFKEEQDYKYHLLIFEEI